MAQLTAEQRTDLRAAIMREWSAFRTEVPMTKPELLTLIGFIDEAAEASDADVITRVPEAHPANSWLVENLPIARRIKELVEQKRKAVL